MFPIASNQNLSIHQIDSKPQERNKSLTLTYIFVCLYMNSKNKNWSGNCGSNNLPYETGDQDIFKMFNNVNMLHKLNSLRYLFTYPIQGITSKTKRPIMKHTCDSSSLNSPFLYSLITY